MAGTGIDPISLAQTGAGLLQSVIGGIQAGRAQRQLSNLQSPKYTPNKSILDFYGEALNRYNVDPTQSAMYKRQVGDINRSVATATQGLQDRRSGTAGVSSLLRYMGDAKLKANVAAENERDQRFGVLGSAAGMKASEEGKAFQINEMMPFERKYNLLAAKAAGGNQVANAGLSNVFGGLQNLYNYNLLNKEYGGGSKSAKAKSSYGGVGYAPDFDNYGQPG